LTGVKIRHLFSPVHAIRDFVNFARAREKHEWWFLLASICVVLVIGWAFVHDSHFEREYKPNIIYVESWPANRTDEEIIAQQQIDLAKERAEAAEFERERAARQAEWKKIDDKLKSWGI
jgi:hypothetical protein